jgi:hypothetical protein
MSHDSSSAEGGGIRLGRTQAGRGYAGRGRVHRGTIVMNARRYDVTDDFYRAIVNTFLPLGGGAFEVDGRRFVVELAETKPKARKK